MAMIIETRPTVDSLVLEALTLEYGDAYSTPQKSSGMCLSVTTDILANFGYEIDLFIAFAHFTGDIENIGSQYFSNHFAVMMDIDGRQMVVDFTLRQFDPNASYPAVLTLEEWTSVLSTPWKGLINVETGYEICGCNQGVEGSCACESMLESEWWE